MPHHPAFELIDCPTALRQTNLVTVGPDDKLSDAEAKLKGIEGMPVVDADGKASWLAGWPGWWCRHIQACLLSPLCTQSPGASLCRSKLAC